MIAFEIPGRLPGLNELIAAERTHRMRGAKLKADAERLVRSCIRSQIGKYRGRDFKSPVILRYVYYEPDRRRDKDNIAGFAHKVIQDSLVREGILKNDGWNIIEGFTDTFAVDKKRPHIEVYIDEEQRQNEFKNCKTGARRTGIPEADTEA